MGYTYFDTPDGEDCGKKLGYMLKKAFLCGFAASTTSVVLVDQPKSYGQTLARYARITIPCLAAATAGTIAVCQLVQYREKDDVYNHFLGGLIGGAAGGLAAFHVGRGLYIGTILGFVAASYKSAKMHNFEIDRTNPKLQAYNFWYKEYDYTVVRRPPDWTAK